MAKKKRKTVTVTEDNLGKILTMTMDADELQNMMLSCAVKWMASKNVKGEALEEAADEIIELIKVATMDVVQESSMRVVRQYLENEDFEIDMEDNQLAILMRTEFAVAGCSVAEGWIRRRVRSGRGTEIFDRD